MWEMPHLDKHHDEKKLYHEAAETEIKRKKVRKAKRRKEVKTENHTVYEKDVQ